MGANMYPENNAENNDLNDPTCRPLVTVDTFNRSNQPNLESAKKDEAKGHRWVPISL